MTQLEHDRARKKILEKHERQNWIIKGSIGIWMACTVLLFILLTAVEGIASGLIWLLFFGGLSTVICTLCYKSAKKNQAKEMAKLENQLHQFQQKQAEAKRKNEQRAREKAAQEAVIALAKHAAETNTPKPSNCPNCGALLQNGVCSYCGTTV